MTVLRDDGPDGLPEQYGGEEVEVLKALLRKWAIGGVRQCHWFVLKLPQTAIWVELPPTLISCVFELSEAMEVLFPSPCCRDLSSRLRQEPSHSSCPVLGSCHLLKAGVRWLHYPTPGSDGVPKGIIGWGDSIQGGDRPIPSHRLSVA
ncbi:MAG: hypothetical protein ACE149_15805 [Armatimonadota bacterium]